MKKIFIGSSKEAIHQAGQVAALLDDIAGVKPLLWTEAFSIGDITFQGIEKVARRVAGAIFLATPDDDSFIRERQVKTPRANVLFEYGYLTSTLTRARVALCRYSNTELPSDLDGLTCIPMGEFSPHQPLDHHSRVQLTIWATQLPELKGGFPPTYLLHGYSGVWHNETIYQIWRRIEVKKPDFAIFRGRMLLQIPPSGKGGVGYLYGNLQVQIGDCYAEFELSDGIINAEVFGSGVMRLRSVMQSRQLIRLEGVPPQKDGYEPMLKGAREFDSIIDGETDEGGVLKGHYTSKVGDEIYSQAIEKWYR